jgi:hypothetical protein
MLTTVEILGVITVTNLQGEQEHYNRIVSFDLTDPQSAAVQIQMTGNEVPVCRIHGRGVELADVVREIEHCLVEQQRQYEALPDTIARKAARRAARRSEPAAMEQSQ